MPFTANVSTSPVETAHRIATSDADAATPVVVADDGTYLGLVSVRRLLVQLADRATVAARGRRTRPRRRGRPNGSPGRDCVRAVPMLTTGELVLLLTRGHRITSRPTQHLSGP